MTHPLIQRAERRDYQRLFVHDLNWSKPDHPPVTLEHDGRMVTATNVSSYRGLRVWLADEKPDSRLEAALDQHLAKNSTDRILIFHDDSEQVWRWPVRRSVGNTTITRLSRHRHRTGDTDPRFAEKLDVIRLPFDLTLDSNAVLAKVRQAFDVEAHNETKHASKLMARLYAAMEKAYPAATPRAVRDHEISVTLARILFLMFGDDTDMWDPNLFRDLIRDFAKPDGSDVGAQLTDLFDHLDTPDDQRGVSRSEFNGFPYVNGRIFTERVTLPALNAEFRTAVLQACDRDWASISPAIFGSMFQSVRDAETRRQLGEHYTSEENILKTLNPLFLDELRAEFEHVRSLGRYEADRLRKLREKLGRIRYMDPACGCGNFIIVAYRELRDLELAIMERLQEITGDNPMLLANVGLKVTLDHFYGIEIDEWPARIAETAMFLVDRQCDLKLTASLGYAPNRLPIQEQATIVVGNALRSDWAQICPPTHEAIVAGNPPFLGISLRSAKQTADLQLVWGSRYHGTLDYVTGWYAKAVQYFGAVDGRWAFVSTSSITRGEAVAPLFQPTLDRGWRIKLAHRTFPWTSEAVGKAAVHCVIVGFWRQPGNVRLFEYQGNGSAPLEQTVANITPYLTDGPTVIVQPSTKPLNPQLGEVSYGNKPTDGGWLVVEREDYEDAMSDAVAAKYIRKYVGARELIHTEDRYCLWLTDLKDGDADRSTLLKERIWGVEAFRAASKAASTRAAAATPHLFRQIAQPNTSYLCIPAHVSESRPYFLAARFDPGTIASNANFITPDADGFMFAIISSSMFITWQRTVGGRLKSDLRFNKLLTWNTFPLPCTDEGNRERIIGAGAEILQAREWDPHASLAKMYHPDYMTRNLLEAHTNLDVQVDRLFGLKSEAPTELERQEVLFARYQKLARR
ncbi:class I SAM-dependent DNA methyltransferase [Ornithinimicrobium sediminis]|uniref:class I SAM-dependent DNA methyltransferase n=1 Tax=Ornithinimicrobium sediminis TaxID=2904603 RepID=UPI001E3C93D0|nr:DNA methyltransferase [Ornithinimicrobium sediminis]MCE0488266.1 class I SAM-dependent DNA methyltransferase [Ornithinimicrobium sediminis]